MKKNETMTFRCTEELKKEIKGQAKENGMPASRFIERKLSEPDPEMIPEVKELKNCFLEVQSEINEIARACCDEKNFSVNDYNDIMKLLNEIDKKFYELIQEIREENKTCSDEKTDDQT